MVDHDCLRIAADSSSCAPREERGGAGCWRVALGRSVLVVEGCAPTLSSKPAPLIIGLVGGRGRRCSPPRQIAQRASSGDGRRRSELLLVVEPLTLRS